MSSLDNIFAYLASDPSMPLQVKRTLQKCFSELSFPSVSLPLALVDGGTGADLSATGDVHEVVMQEGPGDAFTVRQLTMSDIAQIDGSPGVGVPTTGQTLSLSNYASAYNCFLYNPSGTLSALTINLGDGSFGGQIVHITIAASITTLTIGGNFVSGEGLARPTSVTTSGSYGFVWDDDNSGWARFI